MKKYLAALVILLLAFYVAWPAWSVYQIQSAIKAKDAEALARKIDFPSVRASLRSAAAQKIAEVYVPPPSAPTSPALLERLKRDTVSRVAEFRTRGAGYAGRLDHLRLRGRPAQGQCRAGAARPDQPRRRAARCQDGPGSIGARKGGPVVRTVSSAEEAPAREFALQNIKGFSPSPGRSATRSALPSLLRPPSRTRRSI